MRTKEQIEKAWKDVWDCAVHNKGSNKITLMHIPPDKERDADFIIRDALNELYELRALHHEKPKEVGE